MLYKNEDRKCECFKCELNTTCPYIDKYQRLGRGLKHLYALCKKLPENQNKRKSH